MTKLNAFNICERMGDLKIQYKLSNNGIAKKTGLTLACITPIVEGVNCPKIDNLIIIANTFKVSLDWLCSEG